MKLTITHEWNPNKPGHQYKAKIDVGPTIWWGWGNSPCEALASLFDSGENHNAIAAEIYHETLMNEHKAEQKQKAAKARRIKK